MPKYLISASYTQDGLKELLKEGGSSRKAHIEQLIKGMGGRLEPFYYAFGESDLYAIVELPDDASVTAVSLAVGAAGGAGSLKTTVLIDPATVDEAVKKTVEYRPPGG